MLYCALFRTILVTLSLQGKSEGLYVENALVWR
jgi:hypothetical protein